MVLTRIARSAGDGPPAATNPAGLATRKVAASLIGLVVDEHRSLETLCEEAGGLVSWRALAQRDRALAKAICLTALRRRGQIEAVLSKVLERKPPQRARHLLHTLHAGVAQILHMEVPERAAVDLAVTAIAQDHRTSRFAAMTNAVLRRICRERGNLVQPATARVVFPPWLAEELRRDHGKDKADAIAAAILNEPAIDITPSPRLAPEAVRQLAGDLNARVLASGSLRLRDTTPIRELALYDAGLWWVQDAASALPVRLFGAVEGLRIADVCAAPGGKSLQLAAMGALVTALDISAQRMKLVAENFERAKLRASLIVDDFLNWQPGEKFDAILLDAPCSSTGTIRRHPDVMWSKTPEDVAALAKLQKQMIAKAVSLVRPGGMVVYANCSMLKREGENLIAEVCRDSPGIALERVTALESGLQAEMINGQGCLRTLPSHLPGLEAASAAADRDSSLPQGEKPAGMDGFFACRLRIS